MERLSPEVIEIILEATLDRSFRVNRRQLLNISRVCKALSLPAKRLLYRDVIIESPEAALDLSRSLKDDSLGALVRYLNFRDSAYDSADIHESDTEDIIRRCPHLVSFSAPISVRAQGAPDRISRPLYPFTLRHFRCSPSSEEPPLYRDPFTSDDDDDEIDSDSEDEDGGLIKKAIAERDMKEAGNVPPFFRKLYDLPTSLATLLIEGVQMKLSQEEKETIVRGSIDKLLKSPGRTFPLKSLRQFEMVHSAIIPTPLAWILGPSIADGTLTGLKLWGSAVDQDTILTLLRQVPQLERFLYKPAAEPFGAPRTTTASSDDFLSKTMQLLPNLKRLSLGPRAISNEFKFSKLASTSITHLCISLPRAEFSLTDIILQLTCGALDKVRRLELYSQLYFPPPVELGILDDSNINYVSQLRELRLSHVEAKPEHLKRLFTSVGSGLRVLSIHHVSIEPAVYVPLCPSLLRLELGVGYNQPYQPVQLKHFSLHLLRFHFNSQVELTTLIDVIKAGDLPALKTLDATGIFPDQVPDTWTGKCFQELMTLCEDRGIEYCMNGRTVSSIGDLWTALLQHNRYG